MMRRKKNSQKFELFSERKRKAMMRREKNCLNSFFERKRRRRQSFETFGQLAAGDYTNALHSFTQTDDDDDEEDDNNDDDDDDVQDVFTLGLPLKVPSTKKLI